VSIQLLVIQRIGSSYHVCAIREKLLGSLGPSSTNGLSIRIMCDIYASFSIYEKELITLNCVTNGDYLGPRPPNNFSLTGPWLLSDHG